jgi:hypothetical protein
VAALKQGCTHILINKIILHPQSRSSKGIQQDFNLTTDRTGVINSTLERDIAVPVNATIEELDNIPLSEVQGFKEPSLPWSSDQILPFDITVAAANEYGAAASAKLFGVEILNEGFGSSVDDSVLEMQATFVARWVAPTPFYRNRWQERRRELLPGDGCGPKAISSSRVWLLPAPDGNQPKCQDDASLAETHRTLADAGQNRHVHEQPPMLVNHLGCSVLSIDCYVSFLQLRLPESRDAQ